MNIKKTLLLLIGLTIGCHFPSQAMQGPEVAKAALMSSRIKQLLGAVKKNNADLVKKLLNNQPNLVNAQEAQAGNTALIAAATAGNDEMVSLLLRYDADPNIANKYGDTPLIAAARKNRVASVRALLAQGANVRAGNQRGETPLSVTKNEEVKELLRGAELKKQKPQLKRRQPARATSPVSIQPNQVKQLITAARKNEISQVRQLLAEQPDLVNRQEDTAGNTALIAAATAGNDDMVSLLLDFDADPNTANKYGDTPLHAAVRKNRIHAVRELLVYGANPQAVKSSNGETPLSIALDKGNEAIVQLLLGEEVREVSPAVERIQPAQMAQPCVVPVQTLTPKTRKQFSRAINAIKRGDRTRLEDLLKRYPDFVTLKDDYGLGLLTHAVRQGNVAIVNLILQHGADVNETDNRGMSALAHAANSGDFAMVSFLLENGADVNLPDKRMSTPLQYAIVKKHIDVIRILVGHGGIVYAKFVLMLQPDPGYIRRSIEPFYDNDYIARDVRQQVEKVKSAPHMTLAYISIPTEYDIKEGASYTNKAREYLDTLQGIARETHIVESVIDAQLKTPFNWSKLAWLSNFLVISYDPPANYQKTIEAFYRAVKKGIPTAKKTYEEEQKPHISIFKLKRDSQLDTNKALYQPVVSGARQPDIFSPVAGVEMTVRIPSRLEVDHYEASYYRNLYHENFEWV